MPFRQTSEPIDISIKPSAKQVARWLWMIDEATSVIVRAHGNKMIEIYFEDKEAAEQFVLHSDNNLVT